jgi:hypothetical protein
MNSMSPGSLTMAWAIHPNSKPAVLPVRAGPTKTTASCCLLASAFMGSTMYGVSLELHGAAEPPVCLITKFVAAPTAMLARLGGSKAR